MTAEIVCVGTEIIIGDILNTHSQFLSQKLNELGIDVLYHTAVGDNPGRLAKILETACARSGLVIITGGLGPTEDDLTKETLCDLFGIELCDDREAEEEIRNFFARRGLPMPENNLKQAKSPKQGKKFCNNLGTASGYAVQIGSTCVIMLPGPPSELIPMFEEQVFDYLKTFADGRLYSKKIHFFGIGESGIAQAIEDLTCLCHPTVALYAKEGEVMCRVCVKAASAQKAFAEMEQTVRSIVQRLGEFIYAIEDGVSIEDGVCAGNSGWSGSGAKSMEEAVVQELLKKQRTLAVAESCTGGLMAQKITSVPGASGCFSYGIVAYSDEIKEKYLSVPHEILEGCGAVSAETAGYMARGAKFNGKADIGIGITGFAGPQAGANHPAGTVFLGIDSQHCCDVKKLTLGHGRENVNEREKIRNLAALHALDMVRKALKG